MVKKKKKPLYLYINPNHEFLIQNLIEKGEYDNKSQFVRNAIRNQLKKDIERLKLEGKIE